MSTYNSRLKQAIIEALRGSPCTFEELVRKCHGAYPTVVKQAMKEMKVASVDTTLYTTQLDFLTEEINPLVDRDTLDFVTYSVENNPILSSWYISWKSCQKVKMLDLWYRKKILFLGTPRIFEYFILNCNFEEARLIDLDVEVTKKFKKTYSLQNIVIDNMDINAIDIFDQQYDAVFLDPPWYLESYKSWLSKAFQFVKRDGAIYFSIFPFLTRPTASVERKDIFTFCRQFASTVLSVADYFEYDIPSFESMQLKAENLFMHANWKVSDLIIMKGFCENNLKHFETQPDMSYTEWQEFSLFDTRWFLRRAVSSNLVDSYANNIVHYPLLEPIGHSRFLDSPSRRNPKLKKANLLSSKGHAFFVPDTDLFMYIIRIIQDRLYTSSNHKIPSYKVSYDDLIENFGPDTTDQIIQIYEMMGANK